MGTTQNSNWVIYLADLIDTIVSSLRQDAVAVFSEAVDMQSLSHDLCSLAYSTLTLSASDFLGEPNSLTPKKWLSYGQSSYELPLHTDYPDYARPPRFVLMKCHSVGALPVETVFYDLGNVAISHHRRDILLNEPWITTGGVEKSRIVRILEVDRLSNAPLIRYATNVMRPFYRAYSSGREVLTEIINELEPFCAVLTPGVSVIWDNWRVLHSRRLAKVVPIGWSPGPERILERFKWA